MSHPFISSRRAFWIVVVMCCAAWFSSAPLRAQNNWTADPQNLTRANLWGVGYGENRLLAVGEGSAVLRFDYDQPDAGWTALSPDTSAWLLGAAFGAGRWVVVGDRGTLLVSEDSGDSWTARPAATTARLNAIAYGAGRWLAVGEGGTVVTSTDTVTWTARPSPTADFLRALAHGPEGFLVGGGRGSLYLTADATTFTRISLSTTADIEAVAIAGGRYFAAGSGGLLASGSATGAWQLTTATPGTPTFRGLVARANSASAVGDGAAYAYAFGWTPALLRPAFLATAAAVGRDEAVAVGFDGGIARASALHTVAVLPGPVVNVLYGQPLRLTARPEGVVSTPAYQWRRNGAALAGQTQAEFAVPAAGWEHAGSYAVRATAGATELVAPAAQVNILPGGRPEIVDPGFDYPLSETPTSVYPAPNGQVYVGFYTTRTAGGSRATVARLNLDGSLDREFRPVATPPEADLSLYRVFPDGRLLMFGAFPDTVGTGSPRFALLRPDGTEDPTFAPARATGVQWRSLRATTGGRFYAQAAAGTVRLLANGTLDPAFAPFPAAELLLVDSLGRPYSGVGSSFPNPNPGFVNTVWTLSRQDTNGTKDPGFQFSVGRSSYPIGDGSEIHSAHGDWLFVLQKYRGKIYGGESLFGTNLVDPRITTSGPGAVAQYLTATSYFTLADGTMWEQRPGPELQSGTSRPLYSMTARAYRPNVGFTPTLYATTPDLTDFEPLAADAEGTLYARPPRFIVGGTPAKPLVRIRPLTGRVGRLTNLSVRAHVTPPEPLIVGFVTSGVGTTRALVRGIGPALSAFGVSDTLRDPMLTLRRDATEIGSSDDWPAALAPGFAAVGAFPLPEGSRDAALESDLVDGNYTAVLSSADGRSGSGLVELFQTTAVAAPSRNFVNVSARGPVAPATPLIVGFTLTGETPAQVLIRAVGPALGRFGVTGVLADPFLKVFRADTALWENDTWTVGRPDEPSNSTTKATLEAAGAAVGAFPLLPAIENTPVPLVSSADAAMVLTLAPGSYTAQVSASPRDPAGRGSALIEVYTLP